MKAEKPHLYLGIIETCRLVPAGTVYWNCQLFSCVEIPARSEKPRTALANTNSIQSLLSLTEHVRDHAQDRSMFLPQRVPWDAVRAQRVFQSCLAFSSTMICLWVMRMRICASLAFFEGLLSNVRLIRGRHGTLCQFTSDLWLCRLLKQRWPHNIVHDSGVAIVRWRVDAIKPCGFVAALALLCTSGEERMDVPSVCAGAEPGS